MPAAAARMPLRTSQDAPRFLGTADDLARYVAEWVVYYTEGLTWDTFALTRDALPEPGTWEDFKAAICDIYLQHEAAHTSTPLPASLLPISVSFALQPALLPATPIAPSSPSLASAALQLLLPAEASLLPALSDCPRPARSPVAVPVAAVMLDSAALQVLFTSSNPAPLGPLLPPAAPVFQVPRPTDTPPSPPAESAFLPPTPAPADPKPTLIRAIASLPEYHPLPVPDAAAQAQALLPPALPLSLPLFFPSDMSPAPFLLNASLLSPPTESARSPMPIPPTPRPAPVMITQLPPTSLPCTPLMSPVSTPPAASIPHVPLPMVISAALPMPPDELALSPSHSLSPLPHAPPAAVAMLAPSQACPPAPLIPPVAPTIRPLPLPTHDPLLAVPPAPDDAPPTPDDKAFCWTQGGPALMPAVTCIVTILCTMPPTADIPSLRPAPSPIIGMASPPGSDASTHALPLATVAPTSAPIAPPIQLWFPATRPIFPAAPIVLPTPSLPTIKLPLPQPPPLTSQDNAVAVTGFAWPPFASAMARLLLMVLLAPAPRPPPWPDITDTNMLPMPVVPTGAPDSAVSDISNTIASTCASFRCHTSRIKRIFQVF
ncbi:hypothetical protein AX14_006083 [Amanita brunnescens Koide BX004]|nr:hypothetical protein AX14_006083 [Amanita brunnescens Koide BX004]